MKTELQIEEVSVPPLGMKLIWHNNLLKKILLFWSYKTEHGSTCLGYKAYIALKKYIKRQPVDWNFLPLKWKEVSNFQKKVLKTLEKNTEFGKPISYKRLAELCKIPKGARAIGQVMKKNPWPLIIPCHRVLGSDGSICGFSCGVELKKFLLKLEGII